MTFFEINFLTQVVKEPTRGPNILESESVKVDSNGTSRAKNMVFFKIQIFIFSEKNFLKVDSNGTSRAKNMVFLKFRFLFFLKKIFCQKLFFSYFFSVFYVFQS